ncbi:MAG: hypothetical protein Unbinned6284contig1004_19 [Prokaryotic dsDNA virus sp.]|nr:MAG: hypothetical protein Unbinned6284contig1004_19 [Prokaryotic dsDNA virus sp.]
MEELKDKLSLYNNRFKISNNTDLTRLKSALAFGYKNKNRVPSEEFRNELYLIELSGFYEHTHHRFDFISIAMPEQYMYNHKISCFRNHEDALLLLDVFEVYKKDLKKKINEIEIAIDGYERAIK